jgi:methylglutaconyl-CoA hydratase
MTEPVVASLDARGVASVVLNRPEVGNAYNGAMIEGLLAAIDDLMSKSRNVRVVVLEGNGKHFQAGADLKWVREVSAASAAENERVSRATAEAVDRLNRLPVPTVALVQGGCFGGGTGMVAACDVVIAADNAVFSIAEVRWGLTAAIIIPQLSDAISARQLRRYALTCERFDAAEARRIGLVHQVVPLDALAAAGEEMVARLLENGPRAMAETKACILQSAWGGFDRATLDRLSASHGAKRRSPEAAEGLASFADKRAANWEIPANGE